MVDEGLDVPKGENGMSLDATIEDTARKQPGCEIRTATRVISATCNICQQDYLKCSCSYIAQGAQAPNTNLRFAFRYWAPLTKVST